MNPRRKTALITGASSGIGLELSRLLAADDIDLILVARDEVRLAELAARLREDHSVAVVYEARDLSEPGSAARLWNDLAGGGATVDILVNNAGLGMYGALETNDPEVLERMVRLNIVTLTTLSRLALPGMRTRGWGRILNVGSVVGYQPAGPRMAAYYASKAFVVSFSKALATELEGTGVSVTALSPGLTASRFEERSGAGETVMFRLSPKMPPAAVAAAGYAGMMKGRKVVIPGLLPKLLAIAGELPPRWIALQVNRLLLSPWPQGRGRPARGRKELNP